MRVKDAVAACLTEAAGQFFSGEVLAQKLGVSRNAIWKAVRLLQEEGFPIEAKKKVGYRLAQGVVRQCWRFSAAFRQTRH